MRGWKRVWQCKLDVVKRGLRLLARGGAVLAVVEQPSLLVLCCLSLASKARSKSVAD
jgi:hypothetical protein